MKTRNIHLATVLALLLFVPTLSHAQINQHLMQVDIPFAFVAGGVHLPSGQYNVYHLGDPNLIVVQKNDARARAMVYVQVSGTEFTKSSTRLVFNNYGDRYFLSQVWTAGDQEVHQCLKCRAEKALIAKGSNRQVVIIAAKR